MFQLSVHLCCSESFDDPFVWNVLLRAELCLLWSDSSINAALISCSTEWWLPSFSFYSESAYPFSPTDLRNVYFCVTIQDPVCSPLSVWILTKPDSSSIKMYGEDRVVQFDSVSKEGFFVNAKQEIWCLLFYLNNFLNKYKSCFGQNTRVSYLTFKHRGLELHKEK